MIHRRITWLRDPLSPIGGIVCGVEPQPDGSVQTSILASGYDCPDCVRLTPYRQRCAQIAELIDDVLAHGPAAALQPLSEAYQAIKNAADAPTRKAQ